MKSLDPQYYVYFAVAFFALSGISLLFLLFLLHFIWRHEIRKPNRSLATPFNTSLITCTTGVIVFYVSQGVSLFLRRDLLLSGICATANDTSYNQNVAICNFAGEFFFSVCEAGYLSYSWLRAAPILEDVFPRTHTRLASFFKVLNVALFAGTIPIFGTIVPNVSRTLFDALFSAAQYMNMAAGVGLLFVDVVLLYAFTVFVRKTRTDGDDADKQFVIIARFGIAASLIATSCLILFVLYRMLDLVSVGFASYSCFIVLIGVLFAMKYALHVNELQRTGGSKGLTSVTWGPVGNSGVYKKSSNSHAEIQ